jgi:hypothetical protein
MDAGLNKIHLGAAQGTPYKHAEERIGATTTVAHAMAAPTVTRFEPPRSACIELRSPI